MEAVSTGIDRGNIRPEPDVAQLQRATERASEAADPESGPHRASVHSRGRVSETDDVKSPENADRQGRASSGSDEPSVRRREDNGAQRHLRGPDSPSQQGRRWFHRQSHSQLVPPQVTREREVNSLR